MEFFLTMAMLALVGLVVGVGVLLSKEYPKIAEFINRRPVLGWVSVFVAGGATCYFLFYLLAVFLLAIVGLAAGGPHTQIPQ
jgi:hypothetical protein